MRWFKNFDEEILEAIKSPDREIHYEAVEAAGTWGLAAAWPHIAALVHDTNTARPLLLAAIGALATIRPLEARTMLAELACSEDSEIAEAAEEAIAMTEVTLDEEDDEESGREWIN